MVKQFKRYNYLKELYSHKTFCHHLLTFFFKVDSQSSHGFRKLLWITFIVLFWLEKSSTNILPNISLRVLLKKENNAELEQPEGGVTVNDDNTAFLSELSI